MMPHLHWFVFKTISNTAHGGDQIFTSKFLADVAQMHIHDAHFAEVLATSHVFKQLLTR